MSFFKTRSAEQPTPPKPAPIKCTYCGGTEWLMGPEGGACQNILCANDTCRHWFNYSPIGIFEDMHRVEPTADEHAKAEAAKKALLDVKAREWRQAGADLYREGRDPSACVEGRTDTYLSVRVDQYGQGQTLHYLLGYIGAMREEVAELKGWTPR